MMYAISLPLKKKVHLSLRSVISLTFPELLKLYSQVANVTKIRSVDEFREIVHHSYILSVTYSIELPQTAAHKNTIIQCYYYNDPTSNAMISVQQKVARLPGFKEVLRFCKLDLSYQLVGPLLTFTDPFASDNSDDLRNY
jgi:hypothetical protein